MRLFILVDMDYFFAACEELRKPVLADKPFIVGTEEELFKLKGVVQSCNYTARAFGIRSGMPTIKAFELCNDLLYSKPDDSYYEKMSEEVMSFIKSYNLPIEVMSIDECALMLESDYSYASDLGNKIKDGIKRYIGLPSTVGISSSKIYAKMACDEAKPNGIKLVRKEELVSFLEGKPVSKIPGVGPKTETMLNNIGIKTIGELESAKPMQLIDKLGSFGAELQRIAKGLDESGIEETETILSVGREITIRGEPTEEKIEQELSMLVENTISEIEKKGMLYRTVTAKVRYVDFTDKIKSKSFTNYTSSKDEAYTASLKMIRELAKIKKPRKIGVRLSSLIERKRQSRLFE